MRSTRRSEERWALFLVVLSLVLVIVRINSLDAVFASVGFPLPLFLCVIGGTDAAFGYLLVRDPHGRKLGLALFISVFIILVVLLAPYSSFFAERGTSGTASEKAETVAVAGDLGVPAKQASPVSPAQPSAAPVASSSTPPVIAPIEGVPAITPQSDTQSQTAPVSSDTVTTLPTISVPVVLPGVPVVPVVPIPDASALVPVSTGPYVNDSRNPCDPAMADSNVTAGNLVADPYFLTASPKFTPLTINPENESIADYNSLTSGVWYATSSGITAASTKLVPSDFIGVSPLPSPSGVAATVVNSGALELTPSVTTTAYVLQKVPISTAGLNKQYEVRVCVFGDANLAPNLTIVGPSMGIKTVVPQTPMKVNGYLGNSMLAPVSMDPAQSVRNQDLYWTLYRYMFTAVPVAGVTNPYVVMELSVYKNQYAATYPVAWFMRPVIRQADSTTLSYVPPLSAFGGHVIGTGSGSSGTGTGTGSGTGTGGSSTPTAVALTNGDFSSGLTGWTAFAPDAGQSITSTKVSGVSSAVFKHAATAAADIDTMTLSQAISQPLAAHGVYHVSATMTGTATAYLGFGSHVPADATITGTTTYNGKGTTTLAATFTAGAAAIPAGTINFTITSYKQQAGASVTVSNVHFDGSAASAAVTTTTVTATSTWPLTKPVPELTGFVDNFSTYATGTMLSNARWLLMNKGWGGNNSGVAGNNVTFHDLDTGIAIPALRLYSFGGTDTLASTSLSNGRPERQGAAIVTNNYYASGSYFVCAKLPTHTGVVSAFWPFHYLAYSADQPGYWQEPNPIRNTEIDWEMPTADYSNLTSPSYVRARANNWGGQLGGEGGNDTQIVPFSHAVNDGNFHEFGIVWYTGHDNGDGTRVPGYVKWTYADTCTTNPTLANPSAIATTPGYTTLLTVTGAASGQDNIPFRAARFTVGSWFPANGYTSNGVSYTGWGGTPNFTRDSMDISWIAIYPGQSVLSSGVTTMNIGAPVAVSGTSDTALSNARDYWTPETVPNAGDWTGLPGAPSVTYPVK